MAAAQNTLIMMPAGVTKTISIKASRIAKLEACSRATGWTLDALLDRALDNFIQDDVPVWIDAAKRRQHQEA